MNSPIAVALDASGNLFIADAANNRVRMVGVNGLITTVAGNGTQGFSGDGGPAASAGLYLPFGVAVDAVGDLFIADSHNNRVRRVGTNGIISTVAGTNVSGFSGDGGAAINAELHYPYGVAVDAFGNLFIADYQNNRIRRVGINGIITTVAPRSGALAQGNPGGPGRRADAARTAARIECFDISHIQGAETVASLVVWEDGKMNKQAYRKFKVMTVAGVDDFASMREVVERRYRRLKEERQPMPSLVLVDGGLGQLHAAAEALESLGLTTQPLASIAKREEVIYVYGNEDEPVVLDRRSPVLHLVQLIRDESHRFAIGYHRQRRAMRDRDSELLNIPGVGPQTRQRLLTHFGSLRDVQQATAESLAAVVPRKTAETIWRHFHEAQPAT